jgi:hypothetical protein
VVAVFVVGAFVAAIWSIVIYQNVYNSVIELFPQQSQDPFTSRYASPVLARSPSTPLSLQADYVKSLSGFCVVFLCISIVFFSIQQVIIGYLSLGVFLVSVLSTIKSWKTYKANCNRSVARSDHKER